MATRAGLANATGLGAACGGTFCLGIHAKYLSTSCLASVGWKSPAMTSEAFEGT
jgi:hypothetical protein